VSIEENKALVLRIEQAWDSGNLDDLDGLFAAEVTGSANVPWLPKGLEGWKRAHRSMTAAVPDRKVTVEDIIAEGDRVMVRCRMVGTNLGGLPWAGVEPNGQRIDMQWISIYRIANGKVVETWAINEMIKLVQQLGAPPELIASRVLRGGWPLLE
jgi:predicted ester cyclase